MIHNSKEEDEMNRELNTLRREIAEEITIIKNIDTLNIFDYLINNPIHIDNHRWAVVFGNKKALTSILKKIRKETNKINYIYKNLREYVYGFEEQIISKDNYIYENKKYKDIMESEKFLDFKNKSLNLILQEKLPEKNNKEKVKKI